MQKNCTINLFSFPLFFRRKNLTVSGTRSNVPRAHHSTPNTNTMSLLNPTSAFGANSAQGYTGESILQGLLLLQDTPQND